MADLYNDNPFQQVGDNSYIYGTQLNPDDKTFIDLRDSKGKNSPICILDYDTDKRTITFAPKLNNSYDKNFVETVSVDDFAKSYQPTTNAPRTNPDINVYGVGIKALDKDSQGYNTVFGNKIDLNKTDNIVTFPDGEKYSVKNIENGKITFAPTRKNGGYYPPNNDEIVTMDFEQFSKAYNPVGTDSRGNTTIFGKKAEVGMVTTDGRGNTYVVDSIDGNKVRLIQAEKKSNGTIEIGQPVELSPEGYVDATASKNTTATTDTGSTSNADTKTGDTGTKTDQTATAADPAATTDNQATVSDKAMVAGTEENKKVLEANKNVRSYRDDDGKYVTEESEGANGTTVTSEGTGSIDSSAGEKEDIAKKDFQGPREWQKYKAGEHIANGYAQTKLDNYTITTADGKTKTSNYLPYDMILADPKNFSSNELLKKIYEDNKANNYLGDAIDFSDGISEQEYNAIMQSTGKYTAKDLNATSAAVREDVMKAYDGYDPYAKSTRVSFAQTRLCEDWKALKDATNGVSKKKEELKNSVDELKEKYKKIHAALEGLEGGAMTATKEVIENILAKYDVNMATIINRFEPAVCAIELLYGDPSQAKDVTTHFPNANPLPFSTLTGVDINDQTPLAERLSKVDEKINNMKGTGPTPENPNVKKLEEDIKKLTVQINSNDSSVYYKIKSLQSATSDDEKKNINSEITSMNQRTNGLRDQKKKLEDNLKTLNEEIEKLEEEYKKADDLGRELWGLIRNYETNVGSMNVAMTPGGKDSAFSWIVSETDGEYKLDVNLLLKQKKDIIDFFTDFKNFKQVTNMSDFEKDDALAYDSAHLHTYVVDEPWDPRTGIIKIVCVDAKTGERIGSPINVWDQREIAPIKGLRDLPEWHEYDDVPDKIPEPKPKPKPDPNPGPNPGPGPSPTPDPEPTPTTTTPTTTTPSTTTPYTVPPIPEYPVPHNPDQDIYPGGPDGPHNPHTGLDAIYGTGETRQSAAGLGALAGLAAGAAGLGLTGLIGDKKDDEDEENEDKFDFNQKIEDKKEETKTSTDVNNTTETPTEENNTSNPQFF